MKSLRRINVGDGKFQVSLSVEETDGHGINCLLVGGEQPHIGGVAVASPRLKRDGEGHTCDIWLVSLPGHKDAELAMTLVKLLCVSLLQPVCLTVGIHIEGATPEGIDELCNNSKKAVTEYLNASNK